MKKSILLIDDDKFTRTLVYQLLKVKRFDVILADDGFSGLRLTKELQPDLILCDIAMPEMDGYEVLKKLRNDVTTTNIPFIVLTAKTDLDSCCRAWRLGANDYLTKPVDNTKLLLAIANQLNFLRSA